MNKFIAYFDYLGFKEFIENNDLETQGRIMGNNFRDIESALGDGYIEAPHGLIANISRSRINCINFSDTVVFWTNDDSRESLNEFLEAAYKFNWQAILFCFPVRGCIVYGEIESVNFQQENSGGGVYNINSVYGKGLVKSHLKASDQNWAGSVIDESFINRLEQQGYNVVEILKPYAKKYIVPYKSITNTTEEYVLNLTEGEDKMPSEAFKNSSRGIENNFAQYNKSIVDETVQDKLKNTINFLKSYL